MPLNGSAPTNKRNGLAISRIDGEDCFIRDDKTDRAGEGGGEEGSTEAGKAGEGEKGTTGLGTVSHPHRYSHTQSYTYLIGVDKARHKITLTDNHPETCRGLEMPTCTQSHKYILKRHTHEA